MGSASDMNRRHADLSILVIFNMVVVDLLRFMSRQMEQTLLDGPRTLRNAKKGSKRYRIRLIMNMALMG